MYCFPSVLLEEAYIKPQDITSDFNITLQQEVQGRFILQFILHTNYIQIVSMYHRNLHCLDQKNLPYKVEENVVNKTWI